MAITQLPSTHEGERRRIPMGRIHRPRELAHDLDVSGLVDVENGLIDRAIFTDQRLYEQEMARVFASSWLFLGHVEQLQKPGDFFTTFMGEDPMIVTKDKSGRIRAFLNSCRTAARACSVPTTVRLAPSPAPITAGPTTWRGGSAAFRTRSDMRTRRGTVTSGDCWRSLSSIPCWA